MRLISAFPSCICKELRVSFATLFMFNLSFCSCVFLSQTFEHCGIFLQDFQPYTREQGDFIHEALEHLQLNQTSPTSILIKTALSQREIQPNFFRSMKYDCFLYVHINFGNDLFSTIPSFESRLQSLLYQKALFLVFVNNNPNYMYTAENWYLQHDRQHRVFAFWIQNTVLNCHHLRPKPFVFLGTYFFCTFCKPALVRLNSMKTNNILSLKITSFEKNWEPSFAQHFHQMSTNAYLPPAEFCRQQGFMSMYKKEGECEPHFMLSQLIIFATGRNFTAKPYRSKSYDYSKIPQMLAHVPYYEFEDIFDYSSPMFPKHEYPSIIYCFNLGNVTVAETDMWTKYVPVDIWGLLGLCFLLSSVLYSARGSQKQSAKFLLQNVVLFVNTSLKLVGIVLRQSVSHKWKLLGVLELLFSVLLSLYENAITVNVVVPLVPKPFLNTRELYYNNYSFVVQRGNFGGLYNYLSDEYNPNNNRRVLGIEDFSILSRWLERYFLENQKDSKYAIVGGFHKNFHFKAVNFVKEKNNTCYQMYPNGRGMYPRTFYFAFTSVIWS